MSAFENSHPADTLRDVRQVLDFVTQTFCWVGTGKQIDLTDREISGLRVILAACGDALGKLADSLEP